MSWWRDNWYWRNFGPGKPRALSYKVYSTCDVQRGGRYWGSVSNTWHPGWYEAEGHIARSLLRKV